MNQLHNKLQIAYDELRKAQEAHQSQAFLIQRLLGRIQTIEEIISEGEENDRSS